jgi:hypothetical protein
MGPDISTRAKLNFFLAFCLAFCSGSLRVESTVEDALHAVASELGSVRLDGPDVRLPAGWPLPSTIPAVEHFFDKPLTVPATSSAWLDGLEQVDTLSGAVALARNILAPHPGPLPQGERENDLKTKFKESDFQNAGPSPLAGEGRVRGPVATLPLPLKQALPVLIKGIERAQAQLNKAVGSVSPQARRDFLELSEWPDAKTGAVIEDISAQRLKHRYEAMQKFNDAALLQAAAILFDSVDRALPAMSSPWDGPSRVRIQTRIGVVMISGTADDSYSEDDLKNVAVLIDAGGHNRYLGRPAFAEEKQIRVVIDLGSDITVTSLPQSVGGAGTGVFGIGLFAAPTPHGVKTISSGSFSQGAALGGVGVLWLGGRAVLSAERFAQGAATFGMGLMRADSASGSSYVATRSAQGFALTRGVGLFLHRGDKADLKGGLVEPDPREPNGSVSMCQGVGFGPRAYAGGGVGLALVAGSHVHVRGSYFSQGAGYWHGLGGFRLRGDDSTLQARRYDMGSGVHSAFGHFEVFGDHNRILNWGVGPSYGWDHAAGSSIIVGDGDEIQVDWGAGTGSIGSVSSSFFKLTNSKLKLCGYGMSTFFRDEPSYSLQWLEGTGNQLQCQGEAKTNNAALRRFASPWGVFHMDGTRLNENLKLAPPVWPALPQALPIARANVDLQQSIRAAQSKPPLERVAGLVDVAAAFSLDKKSPRDAFVEVLRLPPEQARLLVDALEPAAIDQLIQLSIMIPAHGDSLTRDILKRLDRFPPQKKNILINFLRMGRPSTVIDDLLGRWDRSNDETLKAALLRTMAAFLNDNPGDDPGVRALLTALDKTFAAPDDAAQKKSASDLLARVPFGPAFGLATTVLDLSVDERLRFFNAAPADLTSGLGEPGASAFFELMAAHAPAAQDRVHTELETLASREPRVRAAATALLTSSRPEIVAGAVRGLGQIANKDDIARLIPFLANNSALVRESAAVALARMGDDAVDALTLTLSTGTPRTRALIMAGLSQTSSRKLVHLLENGWRDADAQVELTALSTLDHLAPTLTAERPALVATAKKILAPATDPDVVLALALLK